MASNRKKTLFIGEDIASATQGEKVGFDEKSEGFIFEVKATLATGTGDLDVTIEHSHDGITWYELLEMDQLSATGNSLVFGYQYIVRTIDATDVVIAADATILQYLRANIAVSGTAEYDIEVNAYYRDVR